ncbi:uncharacterized protein J3R85_019896 [Psidium guajava]|nr:uncharacterized protein J3R85_019896 [Psidium guajava]
MRKGCEPWQWRSRAPPICFDGGLQTHATIELGRTSSATSMAALKVQRDGCVLSSTRSRWQGEPSDARPRPNEAWRGRPCPVAGMGDPRQSEASPCWPSLMPDGNKKIEIFITELIQTQ